jgi:hypothetical protein
MREAKEKTVAWVRSLTADSPALPIADLPHEPAIVADGPVFGGVAGR